MKALHFGAKAGKHQRRHGCMFSEFKKFILRGNVLDLAVAVIIGAAFGKIVTSMVEDIIMPVVGLAGKADFSNYYIPLNGQALGQPLADAKKMGAVLSYGVFLTNLVNFLIIAFVIFLLVKAANSFKKPEPVAEPTTKDCPMCLMPIPVAAKKCGHCGSML
jgi:large conductance mechanosensitive channel